jgi:hypothetical protein
MLPLTPNPKIIEFYGGKRINIIMIKDIFESSFYDLYQSTVKSFPYTTKRQHAIDPIKIVSLRWIPYIGVKTLYIKGLAQNTENSKEYNPLILFKNIQYLPSKEKNSVEILDSNQKKHIIKKIKNNDVLVRCNCKDFYWRGNYADHLDRSLYGTKRQPYIGTSGYSVNTNDDPMVCKHLIKLHKVLSKSGLFF